MKLKIDLEEDFSFYDQTIFSDDAGAKNKYEDIEEAEQLKEMQPEEKINLGNLGFNLSVDKVAPSPPSERMQELRIRTPARKKRIFGSTSGSSAPSVAGQKPYRGLEVPLSTITERVLGECGDLRYDWISDRSSNMGKGDHHGRGHDEQHGAEDFRLKVWSMTNGPNCRPKYRRRNTAIAIVWDLPCLYSHRNEVCQTRGAPDLSTPFPLSLLSLLLILPYRSV
ncbi:hypothetical protein IEQ34_000492 [Dendrobium chrysotoxum]|uniref:Uncharacterized protein n=1 Tax=Dendrobium chrysotoxum TaxID=161865 RepID=A0AAV7HRD4_DENCH|nr:hypothetical protein IEQ34_000492 [Dendrobium chrysotoxum]